jgi:hypothetical protein
MCCKKGESQMECGSPCEFFVYGKEKKQSMENWMSSIIGCGIIAPWLKALMWLVV